MSAIAASTLASTDPYEPSLHSISKAADQHAIWSDGGCTLAAAIVWNTPESVHERQPVRHAACGVVVVADCRLDNREELARQVFAPGRPLSGDCDLIIAAWLRWGRDCVDHLLGDFAFALWDPRERLLFCARDAFGCRTLFYTRIRGSILVASNPALLLAHPAVDRSIDPEWLIENLAATPGAGLDTPFPAIERLPGGHWLAFREGELSVREFWLPRPGSLAGLGSEQAIVEEARHLLSEAVACRLRTAWPVGAELTAGIDSGGVVATAHPMLRSRGKQLSVFSRLAAASHSFLGPDESKGVTFLCEHLGIERRYVSSGTGPGLLRLLGSVLDRHGVPLCPWAVLWEEVRELAAGHGIRTMLSGFAGDNCFSAAESSLPVTESRLHNWQWVWNHYRALARRSGRGRTLKPLMHAGLAAFAPPLERFRDRLASKGRSAEALQEIIMASVELRAEAIQRQQSRLQGNDHWTGDRRVRLLQNRPLQFRIDSCALLAAAHGQVWTYPLLDKRLVEFALACPPQIRTAAGWTRRLARLVIEDRVPASVAWNPRKGRETIPGPQEQVLDNGDEIRSRLADWRRHELLARVFDLEHAIEASKRPSSNSAQPWIFKVCGVLDVLQLGGFLERHPEAGMRALQALMAGQLSFRYQ